MGRQQKIRFNGLLVLSALAQGHRYGFRIIEETGLPSGTVYPLLRRFEDAGFVTSDWEQDVSPEKEGRPRRRYYSLCDAGTRALDEARDRLRGQRSIVAGLLGPGSRKGAGK